MWAPAPSVFDLVEPLNLPVGEVFSSSPNAESLTPTLIWTNASNEVFYTVCLDNDNTFATPLYTTTTKPGISSIDISSGITLTENTRYYWKVVATNHYGSKTSSIYSFGTGPAKYYSYTNITSTTIDVGQGITATIAAYGNDNLMLTGHNPFTITMTPVTGVTFYTDNTLSAVNTSGAYAIISGTVNVYLRKTSLSGLFTLTATDSAQRSIKSNAITVTEHAPALTSPGNQTVNENSLLSFTLPAADPDNDIITYSMVGTPTGATLNSTSGLFQWTPDYTQAGNYPITFTVTAQALSDSKSITITVSIPLPDQVTTPNPANGATGILSNQQLSWAAASGATSYDVYFGLTTTGWSPVANTVITSYTLSPLLYATTYYWRIDSKNPAGTTPGDNWQFSTVNYQPDALVKTGNESDANYIGDSIYETTPVSQTKYVSVLNNQTASYYVRVQNDGDVADSFKINGTAGNVDWAITYYDVPTGTDMTTLITSSGFNTPSVPPSAYYTLCLYVTPISATLGASFDAFVTATSNNDTSKKDTVKARVDAVPSTAVDDYVWVANSNSNAVTRIRKSDSTTSTIGVGSYPCAIAVDETYCWVVNQGSDNVSRILKSNPAISTTIAVVNNPGIIAVDANYAWVLSSGSNSATRILKSDLSTTTFTTGSYPREVAVDATYCWVPNSGGYVISILKSNPVISTTIAVGGIPGGLAVDETYCWVTNALFYNVSRILKSNPAISTTITVGANPTAVAVDETYCWAVNQGSNNVTRIKKSDLSKTTITTGGGTGPTGIAVDDTYVWVANMYSNNVTRIKKSDLSATLIAAGNNPTSAGDMTGWAYDNYANPVTAAYQPDSSIKSSAESDTAYIGDNIYEINSVSQTKFISVLNDQTASYHVRIENDGNVVDSFKITGTAGNADWAITYYDVPTGTDVTTLVTGSGLDTSSILPINYYTLRLDVTHISATGGAFFDVFIATISNNDPTKKDVVKIRIASTAVDDYLWVANPNSNNVTRILKLDPSISTTIAVGLSSPRSIAIDDTYVWAAGGNSVTRILKSNPAITTTIDLAMATLGIAVDNTYVWVANEPSNCITRILKSDTAITTTIMILGRPRGIAVDGTYVWVTNDDPPYNVSRILKSDPAISTTITGGTSPFGIAVDETYCWVANINSNSVTRILKSTPAISTTIAVGTNPMGIAVDETYCWVTNYASNSVTCILKSDMAVSTTIMVETNPWQVGVDDTYAWVENYGSGNITRILKSNPAITVTFNVEAGPQSLGDMTGYAYDNYSMAEASPPDVDGYVWVANKGSNTVSRVLKSNPAISTTIAVGLSPDSVAVDENYCWAVNSTSNNITRINKSDLTTTTIDVGAGGYPRMVAIDETYCWVTNYNFDTVSRILKSDPAISTTIAVGNQPYKIAVDKTYVWITRLSYNTITRILKSDLSTTSIKVDAGSINPVGIAVDSEYLWTVKTNGTVHNAVCILKSNPAISSTFALAYRPLDVTADETYIWVTNYQSANVSRILKSNPAISTTISVGVLPYGIAVDDNYCWVANYTSQTVTRILKSDLSTTTIAMGASVFSLGDMTGYAYDHYAKEP